MKNILTIFALLFVVSANTQTIRATIKKGGQDNSVIVAMRPSANMTAAKISTLYFSLAVPATALPRPVAAIKTNFITPVSYTLEVVPGTETINGTQYFVYNFLGDGAQAAGTERDYVAGADNNVAEVTFSEGPVAPNSVLIVSLENGGKTSNSYWNIFNLGNDVTDQTNMFYGGTPTNSALGYAGTSFTSISDVVLPVNFKGFYALKQGDNAKLTWDVSGDEKNSYFQVQRSTDGRNFSNIQKVEALKNGRSDNSYETMDLNLSKLGSKEVYYQIAQFDQDGTKTMSPVRKLSVDGLGKAVVAYPNPTPANAKLVVDAPEAGKGQIILRDNLGRQVQNINAQFNKGINQFELQMSGLSNGDYKVTVQGAGLNETIKLQKIR